MSKRQKMTKKFSKKIFKNGLRTKVRNLVAMPMRGGYRI